MSPPGPLRLSSLVLLLFAALVAFAYLPVVFLGRTQLPPLYYRSGMTDEGSWRVAGRRPVLQLDVDLATPAYYEFPLNRLVGDMLVRGEVPLWNPHQSAGVPLAAQYSARAFFPYQVVEDLSPVATWDFFLLGRLWLAGFLSFLFLRRLTLSVPASVLGGTAYMLSGTFVWFVHLEQMANVAMVLPLLLWALERLSQSGVARDVVLTAVATALVLTAGQPETALFTLALGGLYFLVRATRRHGRAILRPVLRYAVGSAVGIGLAAPLLLPFVELATDGHHIHPAGGRMGVISPTPWAYAAGILSPLLVSGPVVPVELPVNGRWDYLGGYSGVLPWLLIFLALLARRTAVARDTLAFFACVAAALLLKNLDVPPFTWLGRLPVFDQAWSPRWAGPVWTFSLAAATAIASEALLRGTVLEGAGRSPRRRALVLAAGATALALFGYSYYAHFTRFVPTPAELFYGVVSTGRDGTLVALAALVAAGTIGAALLILGHRHRGEAAQWALLPVAFGELWVAVPKGYPSRWLILTLLVWALGLLVASAMVLGRRGLVWPLVALAAAAYLTIDLTAPAGFPERKDPLEPAPYVAFLRENAGVHRVMGLGGVLISNYASALGLYDVHYIHAVNVSSFSQFTQRLLEPRRPAYWFRGLWFTGAPEGFRTHGGPQALVAETMTALRFHSLLGVKYVVAPRWLRLDTLPPEHPGGGPPLRVAYDAEVTVYENPHVLPRAFVVHDVRRVSSVDEALTTLQDSSFVPGVQAVVEADVPSPGVAVSPEPHDAEARILEYGAHRVVIGARTARPGLLVLTDNFYEGWRAEVDGRPVDIWRTDGTFRGVWLESGSHRVVLRYQPLSFRAGLAVALLSCAVGASLLWRPPRSWVS